MISVLNKIVDYERCSVEFFQLGNLSTRRRNYSVDVIDCEPLPLFRIERLCLSSGLDSSLKSSVSIEMVVTEYLVFGRNPMKIEKMII